MPLKILHVVQSVNPVGGGPIEGIRQRAVSHHFFGDSLQIASLDPPGAPYLAFPGVPVEPLRRSWADSLFPFSLLRWVRGHHHAYDAVVANGIWQFHLLAAYLAIRGSSTPFLVFPHGMLDPWFRYRYPLKHLKKWLVWPWAIYPPLRGADAVCFTCDQERLLARHSFWLYDCHEVVVNGIWDFHLLAAYLAVRGTDTPVLVFPHGMLDPWFRYRYPLKHLKKWLVWPWAIYPPLRGADAVCFTCNQERLLARQSFWLYHCHEVVVAYGTKGIPDTNHNYATSFLEAHPPIAGRQRFLFLGRVAPKKGPDLLLLAIATLQAEGLWDPATMVLVLAGPASGSYAEALKRLASRLGVTACLHWTGMLQDDDKWGAFQSADAFVLPSWSFHD